MRRELAQREEADAGIDARCERGGTSGTEAGADGGGEGDAGLVAKRNDLGGVETAESGGRGGARLREGPQVLQAPHARLLLHARAASGAAV